MYDYRIRFLPGGFPQGLGFKLLDWISVNRDRTGSSQIKLSDE